jgi:AraC-like DNA-binding protein
MSVKIATATKIDPSAIKQTFSPIELNVHCCRYWKLKEWEYTNMSFPFWRLYYNTLPGASVSYKGNKVELNVHSVVLIPPHTAFSTSLAKCKTSKGEERLIGSALNSITELDQLLELDMVDHLFIHFNLGYQLDRIKSSLFQIEVTSLMREQLDRVRLNAINHAIKWTVSESIEIQALILKLISQIEQTHWNEQSYDSRILKMIDFLILNCQKPLGNDYLAQKAGMATNSFQRLFKQATGSTIQQFMHTKRIEKAMMMMHNGNSNIDEIAAECGYSDRHHFTKVFSKIAQTSPAKYRRNCMIQ